MARLALAVAALLAASTCFAVDESPLDRHVTEVARELRCLVCQNESLADSQAPLAADLRNEIREQLKAGRSDREVRRYLVARYGDFVLYRPPFKPVTVLLWTGPFLLVALGGWLLYRRLRSRMPERQLSEAERARAAQLLE